MTDGDWLGHATDAMRGMAGVRDGDRVLDVTDDTSLDVEAGAFDAAVSRLGVAFFADPARTLARMHSALGRNGGACTMVFSRPDRNPCLAVLTATWRQHCGQPPLDAGASSVRPDLGHPGVVDRLFTAAGFRDVASTALSVPCRAPSVAHYLDGVRGPAGPLRHLLARIDPAAAAAFWADVEVRLAVFATPTGWEGPHELLLTAGRRGSA